MVRSQPFNTWQNGNQALEKEYLEISGEGISVRLHDFSKLQIYSGNKQQKISARGGRDIGRQQVIEAFIDGCVSGVQPIDLESIIYTSLTTFLIEESLRQKATLDFDLSSLTRTADEENLVPDENVG